ncbi:MAG: hypothetical protein N2559_11755 [Anaerolineae bacterium]|nr:hypothetical protein [Anaerolineae bacterium]
MSPSPIPTFAETYARASGLALAALSAIALFGVSAGVAAVVALMVLTLTWRPSPHVQLGETLALMGLVILAVGVSVIQFADLPAPLWIDSYRHAADIHAILSRDFAPLERVYHFGFHYLVAWTVRLTGMSIPAAMIFVGQVIIVQIGLSFFAFGKHLTSSTIVGLACAVCVWFLTPTPMYFLTWGRYPLLLGIAILPIALIAAMDWLDAPRFDWRASLLALVTLAGLASAHLRLLAFYVVFIAIYAVWRRTPARRLGVPALVLIVLGVGGVALAIRQPDGVHNLVTVLTFWSGISLDTALAILRSHYGVWVWLAAACGLGIAIAQRRAHTLIIVAWFIALVLCATLFTLLGIPLLEVPIVLLMVFFPAAFLVGELARVWHERARHRRFLVSLEMTVALCIVLLGAREMLTIFNPITILFTRADERAMRWIVTNTPTDARFLVNTFEWYPTVFVPSDGGAWIPYFTQRAIVTSPSESFTHVYLGRREGIWRARDFADPTRYVLVYDNDGVRIWQVK